MYVDRCTITTRADKFTTFLHRGRVMPCHAAFRKPSHWPRLDRLFDSVQRAWRDAKKDDRRRIIERWSTAKLCGSEEEKKGGEKKSFNSPIAIIQGRV